MSEIESASIAEKINPAMLSKLNALKKELPNEQVVPPQQEIIHNGDITPQDLEEYAHETDAPIVPHIALAEEGEGLTNRITAILEEHFGDTLPVLHFTNAMVGDDLEELESTGFIERFTEKGTVGKLHVGAYREKDEAGRFKDMRLDKNTALDILRKTRAIAKQFYHHGLRTNKNQLGSNRNAEFSVPAVIVIDKPESLIRGTDNYDHWVLPANQGPEHIVTTMVLHPERALNMSMSYKKELQNRFLKTFIHEMGRYRLNAIKERFDKENDIVNRQNLAIYAHDLVDGYLVSTSDYDNLFPANELAPNTQEVIEQRREKYKLLNNIRI